MSGAKSFASRRARFETLAGLLLSLRMDHEAIRTGNRTAADNAMVRQNRVIERLSELSGVMRAEGDVLWVDDVLKVLAEAETAP